MSKVEVEDVLSSIRRLVSDDVRGLAASASSPRPPTSTVPRLLLTDALRVHPAPVVAPAPSQPVLVLHNPILPQPKPVAATQASALPLRRLHLVTEVDSAVPADVPAGTGDEPASATQGASEIARRLAEIEALLNAQDHSPFETEAAPSQLARAQLTWDAEEAPFIDADLTGPEGEGAVVHDIGAQPVEAEPLPKPDDAGTPAAAASSPVDDEILRLLVREVMLEELRGETGERVTRNLRKIIRTEIARALAGRGLS